MSEPVAILEGILNDPAASMWLREALREALERDPLDALNDVLALADILEMRLRKAYGIS
jgi:hypothetical protein